MAAPTPLEEFSLRRESGTRFVQSLFAWLAGTQSETRDSDFDGLLDRVEDANGDGRGDESETSFLLPDTDDDGLPDGSEDSNLNGRVDEGETNPRKADTDGDGLSDGADASPLPLAGTPFLASVEPDSGPTEGGTLVEIAGRNLPAEAEVWFGELRSPHVIRVDSTRMLVFTPEQPGDTMNESVGVRIAHYGEAPEASVNAAFTFTDRTRARITLESISRTRRAYDGYRGDMAIVLTVPDINIDDASFAMWVDPGFEDLELSLERSEELAGRSRSLRLERFGLAEMRVTIGPGELLSGRIELGTLSWRLPTVPSRSDRFKLIFGTPDVRPRWGGALASATEDAWIELSDAEPGPGDIARSSR
jgi:hypothetical protein